MHEWIENYHEYEAVLHCTNQLQMFESTVVLRAFQTFGWNDASTPGNDNSFVHEETGTIVRYEGALLAIDCGHDRLTDALPDLISVLHGLGWTSAEVYHPPETMKALMTDIGKAIPANMKNFDMTPASVEKPVSEFPESAAMIQKGRAVMQMGGIDAANGTVLEELQSMDPQQIAGPASKEKQAIILLDDEPSDSETDALFVSLAEAPAASVREYLQVTGPDDSESEEPAVFKLPAPEAPPALPPQIPTIPVQPLADAAPVIPLPIPAPVAFSSSFEEDSAAELMVSKNRDELKVRLGNAEPASSPVPSREAVDRDHLIAPASVAAIDVGTSTIVFDSPEAPFACETIQAMFGSGNYTEVVYVRPGSIGEKWRWDLLGELATEKPWFAERLVDAMGLDGASAMLMGPMLTEFRAANGTAQLRDILSALVEGEGLRGALGSLSHTAAQLAKYCDVEAAVKQIIGALAPLMLCPTGLAFVDTPHHGADPQLDRTFCMRSLLTSPDSLLLVVQVDTLDGRFAHWLVGLMRVVATAYGASKMYRVVAQLVADQRNIEYERDQVETAKAELGAKVTAITGEYFDRLRDLGCDVPRLSGSHA